MQDKNPLAHYSGVLSEAVQESAAAPDLQDMLRELRVQIHKLTVQLSPSVDCSGVWMAHDKMSAALAPVQAAPAAVAVPDELIRAAKQALACMDGLQQHLGRAVCQVEADALRAALAATPAADIGNPITGTAAPVVLPEPVASVYTMEALVPGGAVKLHVDLYKPLPAGTKLFAEPDVRALLAGVSGPAAVAVLDYPWRDRLLDGRELVRDQQGFAEHSELPLLDEGMKPHAFFAALGVEMKHTIADDDLSMDEYDAMSDAENWSAWIPRPPIGDAWNLVAIFDTEDGPAAWWARALKESREASHQAQPDARDAERYRYLRGEHEGEAESLCVFGPNDMRECLVPIGSLPGELNAFIDAAIAAAKGE